MAKAKPKTKSTAKLRAFEGAHGEMRLDTWQVLASGATMVFQAVPDLYVNGALALWDAKGNLIQAFAPGCWTTITRIVQPTT